MRMSIQVVILTLGVCLSVPVSFADDAKDEAEYEAEYEATFDGWHKEMKANFAEEWKQMKSAESKARPLFEKAKKLKGAKKEAQLLKARAALFDATAKDSVTLTRGLSYEIAVELARYYADQEKHALSLREAVLIEKGRKWMDRSDEEKVFLHHAAAAVEKAWRQGEQDASSGNAPPRKMRTLTKHVSHYLRYVGGNMYSDAGIAFGKSFKLANEKSEKMYDEDLLEDVGGTRRPQFHMQMKEASNFKTGGNPLVVSNAVVTKAKGSKVTIDYRAPRKEAFDCKSTGKIRKINFRGEYKYHKKCKTRTIKGGHKLELIAPKGLKLKKNDKLTFFASPNKIKKDTVTLGNAAVVHASSKGKTTWIMGVKSSKKAWVDSTSAGFDLIDREYEQE